MSLDALKETLKGASKMGPPKKENPAPVELKAVPDAPEEPVALAPEELEIEDPAPKVARARKPVRKTQDAKAGSGRSKKHINMPDRGERDYWKGPLFVDTKDELTMLKLKLMRTHIGVKENHLVQAFIDYCLSDQKRVDAALKDWLK